MMHPSNSVRWVRRGAGLSDVGQIRAINEDAYFLDDAIGLYVVADGMGGHAAGEIASSQAVDTVHGMIRGGEEALARLAATEGPPSGDVVHEAQRVLESAVQAATYLVYSIAEHEPAQKGMGTTLSVLAMCGRFAITAQVGDSRVYLVRDGIASPLTQDHTLVAWQVREGIISEDEAATSPHRNVVTRAVGSREYVEVDTKFLEMQAGDVFVLCSDGMHGYVDEHEIARVAALGPLEAAATFVEMANDRGGRDNITAVVVEICEA